MVVWLGFKVRMVGLTRKTLSAMKYFQYFDTEFLVYSCRILVSELGVIPINRFIKMNIPVIS